MHLNQLSSPLSFYHWEPSFQWGMWFCIDLYILWPSWTLTNGYLVFPFERWSKGKFYVLILFTLYKSTFSVIHRLTLTLTPKVPHVSLLPTNQPTHFFGSSLSWRHSIIACLLSKACQKNTCEMFMSYAASFDNEFTCHVRAHNTVSPVQFSTQSVILTSIRSQS